MTADGLFQAASLTAMLCWVALAFSVMVSRWRKPTMAILRLAPIALSILYTALILFFFGPAPGGFDTLANVKLLFTADWAALAGWVHYLAFDFFMGLWITEKALEQGLPKLLVLALLPLTFLFGPIGYLAFVAAQFLLSPKVTS